MVKTGRKKTKRADKENCAPNTPHANDEMDPIKDGDQIQLPSDIPNIAPRCTRAGRILRPKKIVNV